MKPERTERASEGASKQEERERDRRVRSEASTTWRDWEEREVTAMNFIDEVDFELGLNSNSEYGLWCPRTLRMTWPAQNVRERSGARHVLHSN